VEQQRRRRNQSTDGGTLQLGGKVTNDGLIKGVNSTVYFGDPFYGFTGFAQNNGDIDVLGGKLFLGGQGNDRPDQWIDSGSIKVVDASTDVLGSGLISAGGIMSIRGGSLSGQAPLEDDGQLILRKASVDLSSLTIGAGGYLNFWNRCNDARRFPPPWDIEEPASSSTALTAPGWYDRSRGAPGGVDDETDLAIAYICSAGARR
jgi:hypothetical protein